MSEANATPDQATNSQATQRIDKWLWHARIVKTRTLAQKLVSSGKVRIDREKASSPSHKLRIGNVLTITLAQQIRIPKITDMAQKRGPYSAAQLLYEDLSPPPEPKSSKGDTEIKDGMTTGKRPDKQQRREALKLKRSFQ